MTGEWQLQGPLRPGLGEMIEMDCRYVLTWSPLRDLKLLGRTAVHICAGRGI
jgi:lipopolysaccharide/colanic/teichoic acid biosynthesis glycosyltransferase